MKQHKESSFVTPLIWLTLVAVLVFGVYRVAQSQGSGYNSYLTTVFSSVSVSPSIPQNSLIKYHQLIWTTSGTVSTCQVSLDTAPDGVTWSVGGAITAQTCTSNGSSSITGVVSANFLRVNMSTLSGGGSVTVVYEGWAYNPSGGGLPGSGTNPFVATSTLQVPAGACGTPAQQSITWGSGAGIYSSSTNRTIDICLANSHAVSMDSTGTTVIVGTFGFAGTKGQHLITQAANNDVFGTVSGTTTTAAVTFTTSYTSTPSCVITPTTAGVTSAIITSQANTGFTITYAPSGSTNFNYMCGGNPN